MSTIPQSAPLTKAPPAQRSWVRRHKFLTALGVLLVIVLVAGYIWGWPLVKPRFHSQYAAALEQIRTSPQAQERLGTPIEPVRLLPSGDLTDNAVKLTFEVAGPKDKAAAF